VTSRETLVLGLTRARERTLRLLDFEDVDLSSQYDPLMSPLVWDLAHIGQQEELWLLRGGDPDRPGMLPQAVDGLYDAFMYPRASRVDLPLLSPNQARAYCRTVRTAALDALDALPGEPEPDPRARLSPANGWDAHSGPARPAASAESTGSFVFAMVVSHENQHDETILQALNLRPGPPLLQATSIPPPGRPGVAGTSVLVPGGPFVLGVDAASEPFSLDNERPAHVVDVPPFRIGRVPVTNGEWRQFIDDGGYTQPRWWSTRGWEHRQRAGLTAPQFWEVDGCTRTRFGRVEDIPADEPVQHVTYFEAEAYAAWAGARLPTETEWEKACAWDPQANARRRNPWGAQEPSAAHANLGGSALRPAPVGAYPSGASPCGAEQMLGDIWEWTSSPLRPWPGFTPMIYQRYSQPFFGGDYRVLRGGSWAVEASILRPSFRNWDHPYRRQIFSGVRLAWSVESVEDNGRAVDCA
jgi:gamma-glutamyl hercynylcysteine S-oxide synthase